MLLAVVVLLVASCGKSKQVDPATAFYTVRDPYSFEQVERAFEAVHANLVPVRSGAFRVGNKDPHGCEEMDSRDGRTIVTVCRELFGMLPIKVMPIAQFVKQFDDASAMLAWLRSGGIGGTPYLRVRLSNVNIGYTGRDRRRVAQIAQAVQELRAQKPS